MVVFHKERMIFRNNNGEIIILNKYDFKNDKLYYQKIMEIQRSFTKLDKSVEKNIFQYKNK